MFDSFHAHVERAEVAIGVHVRLERIVQDPVEVQQLFWRRAGVERVVHVVGTSGWRRARHRATAAAAGAGGAAPRALRRQWRLVALLGR